jgi:hypothetical protein
MRNLRLVVGTIVLACLAATGIALGAAESVTCKDGTTAKVGRGACSHHGGVAKGAEAAPSTASAPPASAPAAAESVTCKDGTSAKAGRGACSHHGGIAKAGETAPAPTPAAPPAQRAAAPAAAPAAKATAGSSSHASGTDPTGATAQCKDGSYSHAQHHTGACSRHGGVAKWLDGQ